MEGCQSKCNYCIHALLGCSHYLSCAFKSECENRTLTLLQRFVGLVLLELSKLSSHAFSQSGNYFARVVPVMMLLTSALEKQRTNISTDQLRHGTEMRPRNLRSDSVFWFWYPTLLLNAPKCIYIDAQYSDICNYFMLWPIIDKWPILKLDKTLKPKIKCLKCYKWDLIFAKDYI